MLDGGHTIVTFEPRDVEVMKLLEEAEDWERLEVWTVTLWLFPYNSFCVAMQEIEQVTLKPVLRRPSLLPRFEHYTMSTWDRMQRDALKRVCDQVRAEQLPVASRHLRFLSALPSAYLF